MPESRMGIGADIFWVHLRYHGWVESLPISGHDDVIKWKHFLHYWPFVRGTPWWLVDSPHKGQWHGTLMFSLICAWKKRLSKQRRRRWFETPSRSLWLHWNDITWTPLYYTHWHCWHGYQPSPLCHVVWGWVGLWGFLWWAPSAKGKDHHGVSSGWSSVWHRSNTGLSSTQYEQIPIILGVWPFWLTPFYFRSITFWRAYG